MRKQDAILRELARKHKITIGQAEEIWSCMCGKITQTINSIDNKNEDGTFDETQIPTIHINGFGKFVPNVRAVRHLNTRIKNKQQ